MDTGRDVSVHFAVMDLKRRRAKGTEFCPNNVRTNITPSPGNSPSEPCVCGMDGELAKGAFVFNAFSRD